MIYSELSKIILEFYQKNEEKINKIVEKDITLNKFYTENLPMGYPEDEAICWTINPKNYKEQYPFLVLTNIKIPSKENPYIFNGETTIKIDNLAALEEKLKETNTGYKGVQKCAILGSMALQSQVEDNVWDWIIENVLPDIQNELDTIE